VRKYFKGYPIKWGTDQVKNYDLFVSRLKECEKHINRHHDLESLSLAFPKRVAKLVKDKGRRLKW
jgi:hypothetical protein